MIKNLGLTMLHLFTKLIGKILALPMFVIFGSAFIVAIEFGFVFLWIGLVIALVSLVCVILGIITHQWLAVILFGLITIIYGWMVMISGSIVSKLGDGMMYFKEKLLG